MSNKNSYIEFTFKDVKRCVVVSFIFTILIISGGYLLHINSGLGHSELGYYVGAGLQIWVVAFMLAVPATMLGKA